MWLVLGSGSGAAFDRLVDRPNTRVLCEDATRCETLRAGGVDARTADPTDPAAIERAVDAVSPPGRSTVEVVSVLDDSPERCRDILDAVAEAFPDATTVVVRPPTPEGSPAAGSVAEGTGSDPSVDGLGERADRVVDPVSSVTAHVLDAIASPAGTRSARLNRTLRDLDGPLAIVTHDNPDPDAIGSAIALQRIARAAGLDANVYYGGDISHQENQAFVNLLDLDLRRLGDADPASFGSIALVDHARPGVNDGLDPETAVDVVIDHHPPRTSVGARFVDLRTEAGATSTILVDHCTRLDVTFDAPLATALLYGIRVDTADFTREVDVMDFEAAARLLSAADLGLLERIESPTIPPDTLEAMEAAIRNRRVRSGVLTSCAGRVSDSDALAQAADRLLDLDGVEAALVCGIVEDTIHCSARGRGGTLDLGETMRVAFDRIGSAGGHVDMAGAQIPIGIISGVDEDEDLVAIVDDLVHDRFFEAVRNRPRTGTTAVERLEYCGSMD